LQLQNLIAHMKKNVNPFSKDNDKNNLYNISTGQEVSEDIGHFLLNMEKLGNERREQFINECSEDPERFERPSKRNKILNFATAVTKQKIFVSGKLIAVQMQCVRSHVRKFHLV
jgi:hypothetical protein